MNVYRVLEPTVVTDTVPVVAILVPVGTVNLKIYSLPRLATSVSTHRSDRVGFEPTVPLLVLLISSQMQ